VPDLSPDGGTTTSTNSTSPALSSTLSESSSLLDVNILQHQQQQLQNTPTPPQQIQVVRNNYQIDQQSPGQQIKLPDLLLETNAYANKTEPSLSNNLLIMANEHKEFSCSVGEKHNVNPSSNNNLTAIDNNVPESDENSSNTRENEDDFKSSNIDDKESLQSKNPNLSIATNIANAFINISSLSSGSKGSNQSNGVVQPKNVNVIVTQQQIAQHFMKTLSFTTSRGGIFVPNVIATNITPQFTVHQYGLHGNPNGPAPNVTVNPSGNFNSNLNALRPGAPNHFRLLFQQTPNINLNILNNQNTGNVNSTNQSPILEASLQTLSKAPISSTSSKVMSSKTSSQNSAVNQKSSIPSSLNKTKSIEETSSESNQALDSSSVNNDQQIRVLTPSEIMKTLPSLAHDNICFNSSNMTVNDKNQTDIKPQYSETSGSVAISFKNSANSSPLNVTSECNTLSSNFLTTKATMSSNNAQIQMVSG
jgi:hypothetical protein